MRGREGAPQGTPMYYHAESYKSSDTRSTALGEEYKARVKEVPKYRKADIKKDKVSYEQQGTPRKYDGKPVATRDWHSETAEYANRTRMQTTE